MKRVVDTKFWNSLKILDHYSIEDRYFMLYLYTNPHSAQLGIYALPKKVISFETGFNLDLVDIMLERFVNQYHCILYNHELQEISVLDSLTFSIMKGGKPVRDLLCKELNKVVDGDLIYQTYCQLKTFWLFSARDFDRTIMNSFEEELVNRELLDLTDCETAVEARHTNEGNVGKAGYKAVQYYVNHIGELTEEMKHSYHYWIDLLSDEIVVEAIKRSKEMKDPYAYSRKILESWSKENVVSYDDIKRLDQKFSTEQKGSPKQAKHVVLMPDWMKELKPV